jgi:hypothetical protein
MAKRKRRAASEASTLSLAQYDPFLEDISKLLGESRRAVARSVNAIMTLTYWEIGRRVFEFEQAGKDRAAYGKAVVKQLSVDLTGRFGKGFSKANIEYMRRFYRTWPITQTLSGQSDGVPTTQTSIGQIAAADEEYARKQFPLSWSHYIRLMGVKGKHARAFYESESLRGGWSIRQLERQIDTQFYERVAMSRNKVAMLTKGQKSKSTDLAREGTR